MSGPFIINRRSKIPVYRQVYAHFRAGIVDGSYAEGACLPSIRRLQKQLGLAPESIKRGIADLAAEGLVTRIQGKGTFVAQRRPVESFWGVVVPFYDEYFNKVIMLLRKVAQSRGLALRHACDFDHWRQQMEIVEEFSLSRAEAIIIVPTRDEPRTIQHYQKLLARQPIVIFDRSSAASPYPYVIQDYVSGVRLAMESLVGTGARRIQYVRDPFWVSGNPIYETMEKAYAQFCREMTGNAPCYWDSPQVLASADTGSLPFDALLCVNDQVACLTVGLLRERGVSVPGQVQVIGHNNADVGRYFTPQITTTCPDVSRMCHLVDDIITRARQGEPVASLQYVCIPRLIQRGSSQDFQAH